MKNKTFAIANIIFFVSFTLFFFLIWLNEVFGIIGIEELLFHIFTPYEGASNTTILGFVYDFLPFMILYLCFFIRLFKKQPHFEINLFNLNIEFDLFPFRLKNKKNHLIFSLIVFMIVLIFAMQRLKIFDFIKNQITYSNLYEEHYVEPNSVNLQFPEVKRNLIYIYLESIETNYSNYKLNNGKIVNLIPNLTKLAKENINFSNNNTFGGALMAPLTSWTIAGIVGQTAGVPLNIPIDRNAYSNYNTFLPGVITIGDILESEGYNQVFMIGSDATFGGRRNYFNVHGNYEILDYKYYKEVNKIPEDYFVFWGFEDKKLFEFAKEKLINLSKESKPFNLTLLTVDTHFYDGYVDEECELKYDSAYANAIMCSDKKVGEFVNWIKKQDFYDNTTIVITGDHLTMNNIFFNEEPVRNVYDVFINSKVKGVNIKNREFTTLDMFPTTLASIGVEIEGNRLALGTNLFSDEKTLVESLGKDYFFEQLVLRSKYYNNKFIYNKK